MDKIIKSDITKTWNNLLTYYVVLQIIKLFKDGQPNTCIYVVFIDFYLYLSFNMYVKIKTISIIK